MCRDALFRMGIQSGRVSRVVLEMSKFRHFCPLPDCLPIRRHVTTIRDRFPPDPLIPPSVSKHSTVYRIRRGNLHPKIHTPQLRDRRAYQPPSPDPHDRSRGGGFFCQRFFARLENASCPRRAVSFSPTPEASGGASASVLACFRLPRLVWSVSFRRTRVSFPPEEAPISIVRARGRERAHVVCGARMPTTASKNLDSHESVTP